MPSESTEQGPNPSLISDIPYQADQSSDFDRFLTMHAYTSAPQGGVSEVSTGKIIFSGWQVPCHVILLKTITDDYQALHVQPGSLGPTLLSSEQEQAMKSLSQRNPSAIVIKGGRSSFGTADVRELENYGVGLEQVIDVDTANWWRLLYDPGTNQIWVDIKDKQKLLKYSGFASAKDQKVAA